MLYFNQNPLKRIFFMALLFLAGSCNLLDVTSEKEDKTSSAKVLKGEASYYANKFQGRRTANGEKYDKNKLTAAHKTLKFDTRVEVINLKNNKKVTVRINDRLPASSKREIDLSRAAAQKLDMIQAGVVPVQIRVLN